MGLFDQGAGKAPSAVTAGSGTSVRPHEVPLDGSTVRIDIRDMLGESGIHLEERAHCLVVLEGAGRGLAVRLGPEEEITVGRSAPARLVLPDARVSRSHCLVKVSGRQLLVTDRGSTNGSFADGVRIAGTAALRVGGTLRVGDHLLRANWWTESELSDWRHLHAPDDDASGAGEIRIEIDEAQRRLAVEQITSSQYFRGLVAEIDSLRPLEDEVFR